MVEDFWYVNLLLDDKESQFRIVDGSNQVVPSSISISPNPASKFLLVQNKQDAMKEINIVNIHGKNFIP